MILVGLRCIILAILFWDVPIFSWKLGRKFHALPLHPTMEIPASLWRIFRIIQEAVVHQKDLIGGFEDS